MNIYLEFSAKMKLMNNPLRRQRGTGVLGLRDCQLIFAITVRKNESLHNKCY